jgi:hypothetical protein
LAHAAACMQDDDEAVLLAVRRDGLALQHASPRLKDGACVLPLSATCDLYCHQESSCPAQSSPAQQNGK